MGYVVGVDLGTMYSAAAIGHDGTVDVFTLGVDAPAIPSVVVLREDGEILTGEAAERRAQSEPTRTGREFKRRLGDPVNMVLGGTPYSAEALMAYLLRDIVAAVEQRQGEPPDLVVLTHPANYSDYKKGLLEEAARQAGLDLTKVRLLTEPQAAAVCYARENRVEPGEIIAIYDFGGGTFDAAVVRRTDEGFELVGNPEGIERLGGVDIDQAVLVHVDQACDGMISQLDGDDPAVRAGLARLRTEARQAKEALSSDTDTSVAVALPGLTTEVRLTREELEGMIRPRLRETVEALQRAVTSAGIAMVDVDRILLVGGSSRIPLVGQVVREATGRPVTTDAHPKLAVSAGAATAFATAPAAPAPAPAPTVAATPPPPDWPAPLPPGPPAAAGAPEAAAAAPAPAVAPSAREDIDPTPTPTRTAARRRTPLVVGGAIVAVVVLAVIAVVVASGSGSGHAHGATSASSAGPRGLTGIVSTVAGDGRGNHVIAAGPGDAMAVSLGTPGQIAMGKTGEPYVIDSDQDRLIVVTPGEVRLAHGAGSFGDSSFSGVAVGPAGQVVFGTNKGIEQLGPDGSATVLVDRIKAGIGQGYTLAYGPDGVLYIGVADDHRVYAWDGSKLQVVAGDGSSGSSGHPAKGDGGAATKAAFTAISAIAVNRSGVVYVADRVDDRVRAFRPGGTIATVAGGGTVPLASGTAVASDGTRATKLRLDGPTGVSVADDGTLYVSDAGSKVIFRSTPSAGIEVVMADVGGVSPANGKPADQTQLQQPGALLVVGDTLWFVDGGDLRKLVDL